MSVANEVRLYLKNRPYILEALESGIVNLSELSRAVQKELKMDNFHAIKAALRRHSEGLRKARRKREEQVLELLKESKITVMDGVSVIITNRDVPLENKAKVKLDSHYVYLADRGAAKRVYEKHKHSLVKKHDNCTAIVVSSGENIEKVPGVVAFLTSLLAGQNVNVIEFISCYTETIIVIDRSDSLSVYDIFSKLTG